MVRKARSMLQRAKSIFNFLDFYNEKISKSKFQDVGFSPREINNWIDLIKFIQSKPLLRTNTRGKRTYIDLLDNKFMLLMKKKYLNQELSYIERESAILLYFKALVAEERLKGAGVDLETILNEEWIIDRPTVVKLAEEVISEIQDP